MDNIGIYEAMGKIQAELGTITKDKRCTQGANFAYRGIDDVYNALNPLLGKHGVFVLPIARERMAETRTTRSGASMEVVTVRMTYRFCHRDGSFVECTTIGEAMDSGDKATNKAMSIAMKYAIFQTFCVATEDLQLDDPDREAHQLAPREQQPQAPQRPTEQSKPQQAPQRPTEQQTQDLMAYLTLKYGDRKEGYLAELSAFFGRKIKGFSDLTSGMVQAFLNEIKRQNQEMASGGNNE